MIRFNAVGLSLFLLTAGCLDFKSVSMVEEFRVLGVRAEPPEIAPGDGTILEILWADPLGKGRQVRFAWMGCSGLVHASEGLSTCDMIVPPIVETAASGGDSLVIPATPPDLLDGVPDAQATVEVTFIILMCAGGTLPPPEAYPGLRDTHVVDTLCRGGDGIAAYRPITISRTDNPNLNPEIAGLSMDGAPLLPSAEGGLGHVVCKEADGCGAEVDITLALEESSYQTFEVIEFGKPTTAAEDLFISCYVTGGDFEMSRAEPAERFGTFDNIWLPEAPGTYFLYIVAHDTRGGVTWQIFDVEVHPPGYTVP